MALDPERLLWVPGQKTIFIPSPSVSRLSNLDLMDFIVREGLTTMRRSLDASMYLNRQYGLSATLHTGDILRHG